MGYQTVLQFLKDSNILWGTPGHMMLSWMDNKNQRNIVHIQTALCGRCMFQLDSPMDTMFLLGSNGQWGMVLPTRLHLAG